MTKPNIDVVFSFDTTGSMYPCLAEVRQRVQATVTKLVADIPGIRVGLVAHGDYCDAPGPGNPDGYVTQATPLTTDASKLSQWVKDVKPTDGCDLPEAYELVLKQSREMFDWQADKRAFVLIGDDVPHQLGNSRNVYGLDWKQEARMMAESGIDIYSVQCLGHGYANNFYHLLARIGSGKRLTLHQFKDIIELIMAVAYKQSGDADLSAYVRALEADGTMNRGIAKFITELGATVTDASFKTYTPGLLPVSPSRFQVFPVRDRTKIRDFVADIGARFKPGRGFYQLTKSYIIQEKKEVVLVDKKTGDMFTGDKAREMIGLPYGERARVYPKDIKTPGYTVFVQSTSYTRVLLPGTQFMYEVAKHG